MSRSSSETAPELTNAVRAVHRSYPTGVTVVTTTIDGVPYGLAVNAFSSISLDPPTVLVCVNGAAASHEHLMRGDHLAVNVLGRSQGEVARVFAVSGGDKFAGLDWTPGVAGSPLLAGAAGYLEVEVEQRLAAYTHTIFIGRVIDAAASGEAPMVYLGGGFFDGERLHAL